MLSHVIVVGVVKKCLKKEKNIKHQEKLLEQFELVGL
jgi:hypothetical protein